MSDELARALEVIQRADLGPVVQTLRESGDKDREWTLVNRVAEWLAEYRDDVRYAAVSDDKKGWYRASARQLLALIRARVVP